MSITKETLAYKTADIVSNRKTKTIDISNEQIELIISPLPGLHAVIDNPLRAIDEGFITKWSENDLLTTWKTHRIVANKVKDLTNGSINLGFQLMISPLDPGGYYENFYESIAYDICFKPPNIPFADVQEMIASHEASHSLLTAPIIPPGEFVNRGDIFSKDFTKHLYLTIPDISVPNKMDTEEILKNVEELIVIKTSTELFPNLSSGHSNQETYLQYIDECQKYAFPPRALKLLEYAFRKAIQPAWVMNNSLSFSNDFNIEEINVIIEFFKKVYNKTHLNF